MVSLIIQGPLVSKGITGKCITGDKSTREIVETDCRRNIDDIVDKYGNIFDHIVLCTWKGQDVTYRNEKIKILLLEDPFDDSYRLSSTGFTKLNNKQRQFYSTLKGIEYLESIGYEGNVLKLRTDQSMNFNEAVDFFEREKDSDKVFMPVVCHRHKGTLYPKVHFSDYYFYGKLKVIQELCLAQFCGREKADTPHRDVFFRYAWKKFGGTLGVYEFYYFSRTPFIYEQNKKVVEKAYNELFAPMPKKCFETLVWRGERMAKEKIPCYIFYEDWVDGGKDAYLSKIRDKKPSINLINSSYAIYAGGRTRYLTQLVGKYYTYLVYFLYLEKRIEFLRRKI